MSSFAIVLHDDDEESHARIQPLIEEHFGGDKHFRISENTYVVTGVRLVEEVAAKLGLNDEEGITGAVLRLNGSFGGRSYTTLWDWLRAADASTV